jgi:hypothetical protein
VFFIFVAVHAIPGFCLAVNGYSILHSSHDRKEKAMTRKKRSQLSDDIPDWRKEQTRKQRVALQYGLRVMEQYGLVCLVAHYSGEGDSGQIEDLLVFDCQIPPAEIQRAVWELDEDRSGYSASRTAALSKLPYPDGYPKLIRDTQFYRKSLADCLIGLAEQFTPMGYQDGDGGQGWLVFDLPGRRVTCLHGTNYLQVEYECQTIELGGAKLENTEV